MPSSTKSRIIGRQGIAARHARLIYGRWTVTLRGAIPLASPTAMPRLQPRPARPRRPRTAAFQAAAR